MGHLPEDAKRELDAAVAEYDEASHKLASAKSPDELREVARIAMRAAEGAARAFLLAIGFDPTLLSKPGAVDELLEETELMCPHLARFQLGDRLAALRVRLLRDCRLDGECDRLGEWLDRVKAFIDDAPKAVSVVASNPDCRPWENPRPKPEV